MNAIYKELSDEAFVNIALGGNYFKLAHLDEQLGEIVHHPRGSELFFVTNMLEPDSNFSKWVLWDRTCKHAQTQKGRRPTLGTCVHRSTNAGACILFPGFARM